MSDNLITFIPEEPTYLPDIPRQQRGVALVKARFPLADQIRAECSPKLRFIDCGENFECIACPACSRDLETRWWVKQLDQVLARNTLTPVELPCCGTMRTINELTYEWPQGFTRFSIEVQNPHKPDLAEQCVDELEPILGCSLRIIYTHR